MRVRSTGLLDGKCMHGLPDDPDKGESCELCELQAMMFSCADHQQALWERYQKGEATDVSGKKGR